MIVSKINLIFSLVLLSFITSCSRHSGDHLQGYIEGEFIYVTSLVPGKLLNLNVTRGQQVTTNQQLFNLDPQPEIDTEMAAKATLEQLRAELIFDKVQLERQINLYPQKATDKSSVDRAQRDFDSKSQQIQSAIAQLKQTEWSLHQKTIYAPLDSEVSDIYFRLGENVAANQPVMSLLAPRYIHVLFYVPESLLSQIRIEQTISFTCDNCKDETHAIIHYISPQAEYTPPIIYSKDTRYKLVYLIRADMPDDVAKQFHPGQPVDVSLHE